MVNFYYGSDQGQSYWINLDHVCFVKPDSDKLILKMSDGNVVGIDGEDYNALTEVLVSLTLNQPPVDDSYVNSQLTDDDHLDIQPPTGIPLKSEDWRPKDCV